MDFDNLGLTEKEFKQLSEIIEKDLRLEGIEVKIKTVTKDAYRIKIRIPKLLFDMGLSSMSEQKILIQVDTVPQNFNYKPDKPLLNKFDVFTQINAVPKNLLLSQKIYASVNRKRIMGRDFFDIVFLNGIGAKPDFKYLEKTTNINNSRDLKKYLLSKTVTLNFKKLSKDVEPFLFNPEDNKKVLLFREFLKQKF